MSDNEQMAVSPMRASILKTLATAKVPQIMDAESVHSELVRMDQDGLVRFEAPGHVITAKGRQLHQTIEGCIEMEAKRVARVKHGELGSLILQIDRALGEIESGDAATECSVLDATQAQVCDELRLAAKHLATAKHMVELVQVEEHIGS